MLGTRVIPCLLLKDRGLVKTVQFKNPTYVGDPMNVVKIFNEKEVDELIFLDIAATPENKKPSLELISKIASECFMPFAYGGGIRTIEEIKEIFNLGAEKAIINSCAVENPDFILEASQLFGSQSIVVSINVRRDSFGKHFVFTHGAKKATKIDPVQFAIEAEKRGGGEIFLNSIDRDGMRQGYDLELIKRVSRAVNIPIIACGGAGKLEDFFQAVKAGASAVAAGSLFVFYGKHRAVLINYPTIKELERIFES